MSFKERIIDYSKGDNLRRYWRLFNKRSQSRSKLWRDILTFRLNRIAHRHGGYIGNGAAFGGVPVLPHGLHGIYISRYAVIGSGCRIYQNVTIGENGHTAPQIGEGCLIGAGAVIIGGIKIGSNVRIGAGAVVCDDIPDNCTVVAGAPRVLQREFLNV